MEPRGAEGPVTWFQVAAAVRQLRKAAHLSQAALGEAAGVVGSSPNVSISRLETKRAGTSRARLHSIVEALSISPGGFRDFAASLSVAQAREILGLPEDYQPSGVDLSAVPETYFNLATLDAGSGGIRQDIDEWRDWLQSRYQALNPRVEAAYATWHRTVMRLDAEVLTQGLHMLDAARGKRPDSGESPRADGNKTLYDLSAEALKVVVDSGIAKAFAKNTAMGALGGAALSGGAFAAVATWGTASTGIAIAELTGVAASNATLAALGGGALTAGGAGMAGGALVLTGLFALPILAAGLITVRVVKQARRKREAAIREELREFERNLLLAEDRIEAQEAHCARIASAGEDVLELYKALLFALSIGAISDPEAGTSGDPVELMRQLLVLSVFLCSIPVWAQGAASDAGPDGDATAPIRAIDVDAEIATADAKLAELRQQVRLLSAVI